MMGGYDGKERRRLWGKKAGGYVDFRGYRECQSSCNEMMLIVDGRRFYCGNVMKC
jgi:hypothetical protein